MTLLLQLFLILKLRLLFDRFFEKAVLSNLLSLNYCYILFVYFVFFSLELTKSIKGLVNYIFFWRVSVLFDYCLTILLILMRKGDSEPFVTGGDYLDSLFSFCI